MSDLFTPPPAETPQESSAKRPLAARMRPQTLEEIAGQEHILGPGKLLRRAIEADRLSSLILYGPPGCGKTSLAEVIARSTRRAFDRTSGVLSNVAGLRQSLEAARQRRVVSARETILFIDEIHRFNKAQQSAFLPYVERGDVILFGSTTENPSFEVIAPLLSRTKVLVLKPLDEAALKKIIDDALTDEVNGLGRLKLRINDEALKLLLDQSNGDARRILNALEIAASLTRGQEITAREVEEALQKRILLYDKAGEEHFNLISALHKSLRNSDVDASLYWLARMLYAGEDPLYIARRLVRFASEDVGLADPQALAVAMRAKEAYDFLGSPEGELALAEAVVYLASAPKSNRIYVAFGQAMKDVEESPYEPVPLHIRNPVTPLMKEIGYGQEYQYAHDHPLSTTDMETFPERLRGRRYYQPGNLGFEKEIQKRIDWWEALKEKIRQEKSGKKD